MAQVEDTNVIHRGGMDAALYVREQARKALLDGGAVTDGWQARLSSMNQDFIEKNISPGGCADLLALTVFSSACRESRLEEQTFILIAN